MKKFENWNLFDSNEENQRKLKEEEDKKSSGTNSSTLSLHIAAYENAVEYETIASLSSINNIEAKQQQYLFGSFEIPRQQDDSPGEPEVMQFKASQKVLNPNEANSVKRKLGFFETNLSKKLIKPEILLIFFILMITVIHAEVSGGTSTQNYRIRL